KPTRVQAVGQPRNIFAFEVQLLQVEVEQRPHAAEHQIFGHESVELMSMNCQMPLAIELPDIFLIDPDAYQMRHDCSQTAIVIAFHPDHFDFSFGIRQLADQAEEFPVCLGKPAEVEIGKDVAQKNQASKGILRKHSPRIVGTAKLRSQVQIGQDERVIGDRTHHYFLYYRIVKA